MRTLHSSQFVKVNHHRLKTAFYTEPWLISNSKLPKNDLIQNIKKKKQKKKPGIIYIKIETRKHFLDPQVL